MKSLSSAEMTLAKQRKREARLAQGLAPTQSPADKLAENPSSLRLAINAKCWDCEGRDADPAVNWRIGNCVIPKCPLYAVRPFQKHKGKPAPKVLQTEVTE